MMYRVREKIKKENQKQKPQKREGRSVVWAHGTNASDGIGEREAI